LADKSLLVATVGVDGRPRYRMLETLRAYGIQRATANGTYDLVCRRHAELFAEAAEAGEQGLCDGIVAKARRAQDNGKERVGRRVDSLRAREAWTRTRLREVREADQAAWDAYVVELDRELDELEIQMAISEARLDAELADDDVAVAAAVDTELDAWSLHIDALHARKAAARHRARAKREAAILRLRERLDSTPRSGRRTSRTASPTRSRGSRARCSSSISTSSGSRPGSSSVWRSTPSGC
jgi:hypothetical protein